MQRVVGVHFGRLIIFCKHGLTQWELDESHLLGVARHFLERFEHEPGYLDDLCRRWRGPLDSLYECVVEVNRTSHRGTSTEALLASYEAVYRLLLEAWDYFLFIDAFDPHGDRLLRAHLAAEGIHIAEDDLRELLRAGHLSYAAEQRLDLLRIASAQARDTRSRLLQHQEKYYWVHNNYGHVRDLPLETFEAQLQQVLDERSPSDIAAEIQVLEATPGRIRAAQDELAREYALPDLTATLLGAFSRLTEIRDQRKAMSMRGLGAQRHLLRHIAERVEVDVSTLECLAPWEVAGVQGRSRGELSELRERRRGSLWYFTDLDNMTYLDGQEARGLIKQIEAARTHHHADVRGMVANKGLVRGRVRKIITVADFSLLREGEVLVTPMTRPEFSPVIKRAAALVTDEGGVTCHAAVISREFDKPCVIGTRVATKVFQDGEYVEVDANTGVIRRLPHAGSPPDVVPQATRAPVPPRAAPRAATTARRPPPARARRDRAPDNGPILFFDDIDAEDVMQVGGKGANLGRLYSRFPVPNGFVVTTDVLRSVIDRKLHDWGTARPRDAAPTGREASRWPSAELRRALLATALDAGVAADIDAALGRLRGSRFAVRSSAVAEDLDNASSAGQLETFLEVPRDKVVESVLRCWASLYTPHAIDYRLHHGFGHDVDMGVIVQEMVDAELSGVMFTLDPVHREFLLIELIAGLGEELVSGAVSPSTFLLNRATLEIEDENLISDRVATALREESSRAATLRAIARFGQEVEAHYGQPQDIEFSIDRGDIFLLQSRPITSL